MDQVREGTVQRDWIKDDLLHFGNFEEGDCGPSSVDSVVLFFCETHDLTNAGHLGV